MRAAAMRLWRFVLKSEVDCGKLGLILSEDFFQACAEFMTPQQPQLAREIVEFLDTIVRKLSGDRLWLLRELIQATDLEDALDALRTAEELADGPAAVVAVAIQQLLDL
jgi:hypothetical protein